MILFSACLVGKNCKYNGSNNRVDIIYEYYKKHGGVLVCPEQMGGLPTPRIPSERCKNCVINQQNQDVTKEFFIGSEKALQVAKENNCHICILKKNSPSCSKYQTYDGTFTHTLVNRPGVFAEMCMDQGFEIYDEDEGVEYLSKIND